MDATSLSQFETSMIDGADTTYGTLHVCPAQKKLRPLIYSAQSALDGAQNGPGGHQKGRDPPGPPGLMPSLAAFITEFRALEKRSISRDFVTPKGKGGRGGSPPTAKFWEETTSS